MYRTRDRVRYDEQGKLEFLGRNDHLVKIGGYRIEPGEIEAVLAEYAGLQESVVVGRAGAGKEKILVGYVIGEEGKKLNEQDLRQHVRGKLPEYMVPARIVQLETFPLNANGKIDRRALPAPEQEVGKAGIGKPGEQGDQLEEMIGRIWSEVLGKEQVGSQDNFFALGGHSLLATRLVARVRTLLGIDLPLKALFEAPTLAQLTRQIARTLQGGQGVDVPPLLAASREQPLPLSFAQQRLWFLDQLEPGGTTYLIPLARRWQGPLDQRILEDCFQELVQRHESLRTTFDECDDQPVQVIAAHVPFLLPVIDLQGLESAACEQQARRLTSLERALPCDLQRGPLLRVRLLRLGEMEHILLLTMHHIISDGWSNEVLFQELTTLYRALSEGRPSPLEPLPIQYADFALWQRQWLQGAALEQQVAYWRKQLAGVAPLELPTDYRRPPVQSHRGARYTFLFPLALQDALQALSQREQVTLFMLLLAAFQVLLARYSGQEDIAIGTVIANRTHKELEQLVGFFANTLVLRCDLSSNPRFVDVLRQVREVALGAYAHQDVPFEKLVEVLQPQRDMSRSPLFQVMLVLQNVSQERREIVGMSTEPWAIGSQVSAFDLTLILTETGQGLHATLEYCTDLFEAETISRMLTHFQTLLEGIVPDPQARVWELPLLTDAERSQVLVEWNATQAEYPQDLCVHQLIEQQVERTPDVVALVHEDEMLTYEILNQRTNQLGHVLQGLGVGPEVLVGVCMPRGIEMVMALLSVLKAGGAYVPLDPTSPAKRLAYLVQDAQVSLLLTQQRLPSPLPASAVLVWEQVWGSLMRASDHNPSSSVSAENIAYVMYTSGSTGLPKGVMNTHRGIGNTLLWLQETCPLTQRDTLVQQTSLSFDTSLEELFWPLIAGARVLLARPEGAQESAYLLGMVRQHALTVLDVVPSVLQSLLDDGDWSDCHTLRLVISGGETLSWQLQQRFFASHQARLYNTYGPTEAAINATSWACQPEREPSPVPIGRPIANTQIYLLDSNFQPVPIGVAAEVYLAGVNLARGYLGRADLTAERFLPHPFVEAQGARLYRTGDRARYLPDGSLEYLGRGDQQVKLRGQRIELAEIEAVLLQHEGIQDGVILAREDEPGKKRLVAYLVVSPGSGGVQASRDLSLELRTFLQERLPVYMIPSAFVALDALPLTPNGKVDRQALQALQINRSEERDAYLPPSTPVEEMLARRWQQLLGVERVGISDNFFEMGGHSLLATRVVAWVREAFQVELPLRTLFESPTISDLAAAITQRQIEQADDETLAQVLAELEQLSEDEVQEILVEKGQANSEKRI